MADKEVQIGKSTGKKTTSASKMATVDQNNNSSGEPVLPIKPSTSKPHTTSKDPGGVSKEVLLILKEMNSNLNSQNARLEKQDTRIEKQEQRLESLFEYISNPTEMFDQGDEFPLVQDSDCDPEYIADIDTSMSATKPSIFKSLLDKYQQVDAVDKEVNDDLAQFVNTSFRNGLPDEKQSDIVKDIHRPQNCDALVKTRVNQGIWRLLKMHTQADDNRMQSIQDLLVKATSNLVKLTDKNAELFDPEDMNWSTNAIALLGQVNKLINVRRKELHKSDLDPKYHYLASASLPFTDLLYGDDNDVNKNVKEINDLNKIGRSLGRGNPRMVYRGYNAFRRPFPYRRGAFRGRGSRGRSEVSASAKNFKPAPKK